MCKCNICGNTNREIVYTSMLDGNICEKCSKLFFIHIDNDIKAILYNKPEVMKFITSIINTDAYKNIVDALKDIQKRYTYFINGYCINNGILTLYMKSKFKGNDTVIALKITDKKTEYTVILKDKTLITREFTQMEDDYEQSK